MFIMASHFKNLPIISLRNAQIVARAGDLIINPKELEVAAVHVKFGGWGSHKAVIMTRDIREVAREGMVVDSLEDIEDVSEIVRLQDLLHSKFRLFGVLVVSEGGQNLGHVEDFALDSDNFKVQKLYVKPSLLNNLVIDRKQVVEVTQKKITVRDATVPKPKLGVRPAPAAE